MSLIDERTGSFQSLVISDRGRFRMAHSGDVKVYENLDVLPRAFVVHQVQLVDDDAAALAAMQDVQFDPSSQAVLSLGDGTCGAATVGQLVGAEQGVQRGVAQPERASIVHYRPEQVVIEARLDEAGVLLLTDAWYPGWQATVDGEPASLCRADLLFRAVAMDPGDHRVVLTFRPLGQRLGGAVSVGGLFALVICVGFVFRRAR
jgi:hypothetical protein